MKQRIRYRIAYFSLGFVVGALAWWVIPGLSIFLYVTAWWIVSGDYYYFGRAIAIMPVSILLGAFSYAMVRSSEQFSVKIFHEDGSRNRAVGWFLCIGGAYLGLVAVWLLIDWA